MKNHSKRLLGTSIDARHFMVPGLDLTANSSFQSEDLFITEYLINQQHKKRICKLVRLKDCLWRGKHRKSGWRQEDCPVPSECWRVTGSFRDTNYQLCYLTDPMSFANYRLANQLIACFHHKRIISFFNHRLKIISTSRYSSVVVMSLLFSLQSKWKRIKVFNSIFLSKLSVILFF